MSREVMQQALEALEADDSKLWPSDKRIAAITALRAALAEPQDAPVACLMENLQSGDVELAWNDDGFDRALWCETPLYTRPQRQPLTREAAIALWKDRSDGPSNSEIISYCRAIERAHGIE